MKKVDMLALLHNEEGAEALEYVAIVAIIVVIAALIYGVSWEPVLQTGWNAITTAVQAAIS